MNRCIDPAHLTQERSPQNPTLCSSHSAHKLPAAQPQTARPRLHLPPLGPGRTMTQSASKLAFAHAFTYACMRSCGPGNGDTSAASEPMEQPGLLSPALPHTSTMASLPASCSSGSMVSSSASSRSRASARTTASSWWAKEASAWSASLDSPSKS